MPDLLVNETERDYHLEMCPEATCPAPTEPTHTRAHFRRTWGKVGTVLVEEVVGTVNADGTVSESSSFQPGPISLDQIKQEFTLLYEALPS